MKRFWGICSVVFLVLITFSGTALAIDVNTDGGFVRRLKFAHKGPGTPPENAFPLVCYVVAKPYELVMVIRKEARDAEEAAAKGQTVPRPMAEQFKDGVPMPAFVGYYVVDENFRLTFVSSLLDPLEREDLKSFNEEEKSYRIPQHRSWYGVLAYIQGGSDSGGSDTMVYTLGVPPDPEYVPEIRKSVIVPLERILNPDHISIYPPTSGDFDATIINPKPGMTFKVIDNDFIIP